MTDLFDLIAANKLAGGTSDYRELSNKPQINGHSLTGNQSSSDLGIVEPSMSSNGDIYFGSVRVARVMDSASYAALQTKENIFYLTYPPQTREAETGGDETEKDIGEQLRELVEDPGPDLTKGGDE